MIARHSASKTQSPLAQDAPVRVGTQEGFHQHREPRLLRFLARRHLQRVVNLWQQRAAFTVGQKSVVAHHFKQVRHGEGDVLPVAVGQDVLLFGNPLLGAFEAAAAASFGFASLAEKA